jgi:hypothetical protein
MERDRTRTKASKIGETDKNSEADPAPGSVPEIIDPVFAKTSPKRSYCMTENEHFGLVFVKIGSINSGTGAFLTPF